MVPHIVWKLTCTRRYLKDVLQEKKNDIGKNLSSTLKEKCQRGINKGKIIFIFNWYTKMHSSDYYTMH